MTETKYRKKLIEVALPLEAINRASAREKSIRHGHPSTLHLWWARRPLAAARAVLFAQLVDDPSAWPELFPTEEAQEAERKRLFQIIEDMVPWEASNNEEIIGRARREIARSWARSHPSKKAKRVLAKNATAEEINDYLATELPPIHDPFAGGGTIPFEAQRLGLRAIASDLNPVAVLINKALIEIPPRFAGKPPVNPESRSGGTSSKKGKNKQANLAGTERTWKGSQGLAEDVRYYGRWMHDEAKKRIGHLYPDIEITSEMANGRPDLEALVGEKLQILAWVWARTTECPNPACRALAPLIRSFSLATKAGRQTWLRLEVDRAAAPPRIRSRIVVGEGDEPEPTIMRTGGRCVACESPIPLEHIRAAGRAGHLGNQLLACVSEANRGRVYLSPLAEQASAASLAMAPHELLSTELPSQALGFRVQAYGLTTHRDLFTQRQLVLLSTFAQLTEQVRTEIRQHFNLTGTADPVIAGEYADAVATYLGLSVSRMANYASCLCFWSSHPKDELVKQVFSRNALVMAPDYAETNPFANSSGGWLGVVEYVAKAIPSIQNSVPGRVEQRSATQLAPLQNAVVSCDPPYYDNIGYASLSDFFYVWLRLALRNIHSELMAGVLTPKNDELVSEPGRFATKEDAQKHFESGLSEAFARIHDEVGEECPTTIFYAFKQSETEEAQGDGRDLVASSGWEKMLSGLCSRHFMVMGTWPARTELSGGLRELGRNALASSIVLACRKRPHMAPSTTRPELRRTLSAEIPAALRALQHGNIAPVDLAQAAIGPGMAIFSRYTKVLEADGTPMTVRAALQLINEVLDEHLTEQEGELDADSRFAVTWYENHAFDAGPYGEAETLAKARAVAVSGLVEAGIVKSGGGKVRLLKRSDLPGGWDPTEDVRLTVWEATQHLIKRLDEQGEAAAAELLGKLGSLAGAARDLAYRLYSTCERKRWAEDARAYNGLVAAWSELERLASQTREAPSTPAQQRLL